MLTILHAANYNLLRGVMRSLQFGKTCLPPLFLISISAWISLPSSPIGFLILERPSDRTVWKAPDKSAVIDWNSQRQRRLFLNRVPPFLHLVAMRAQHARPSPAADYELKLRTTSPCWGGCEVAWASGTGTHVEKSRHTTTSDRSLPRLTQTVFSKCGRHPSS